MGDKTGRDVCLSSAHAAVVDRGVAYGNPAPFFSAVARRWSLTLGVDVTPRQVVLCLIDMKVARAVAGGGQDTAVDISGYGACLFEVDETFGPPKRQEGR